jgi:hypothetical protein
MNFTMNGAKNLDPAIKTQVPDSVFIPCPAVSFKQTRVARCPQCQHFRGFVDTVPQAAQPVEFVDRYRVFCGHPISRRMAHVEIDG